jgi:Ni/Co efflux regulator RcnB
MRRMLISAAVLALMAAPVMAQPDKHDHADKADAAPQGQDRAQQGGGHDRGGDRGGNRGAAPAAAPAAAPQQQGGGHFDRGGQRGQQAAPAQVQAAPVAQDRGNRDRNNWQNNRGAMQAPAAQPAPQNRDNRDRNNWQGQNGQNNGNNNFNGRQGGASFGNRPGGNAGQRQDYSGFRDFHRSFNAPRRFQAPAYRRPNGWYDHRWSFGEFLPSLFWAPSYWLNDYYRYGLPQPPYGAVWVREGYDALLIDRYSGEIITVEYGVFY